MTSLTERYVAAVVRSVPESAREDVSAELRASIDDQVEARLAAGENADHAERAVLTDLGDPAVLAAGYADRPLWLLGPRYFLVWWRLLKLLTWIVLPAAGFGIALGKALDGSGIGEVIGTTVVALIQVSVNLGFWTTLVFVIIDRTDAARVPLVPWSLDQLPEPRSQGAGRTDMIASLVFLFAAAVAICWDRWIGFVRVDGEPLPLLNPDLWPLWIAGLFVLMVLEGVLSVVIYLRGSWSPALATLNALLALAVAVPAIALLFQGALINPEFFGTLIEGPDAEVQQILGVLTGFGIAGIALWDIIDGYLKAFGRRTPGRGRGASAVRPTLGA